MMKKLLKPLLFILFIFISTTSGFAQGDLMIMPKRLVFDGSQRSQEINLANTGSDTAVYAISFVNYVMTEDGNFKQVEKPEEGQRFATDYLRYFPRRVTLAPREAQTIRVQLTRTGNLEQGEYRSHMYFRAVEEQKALGEEETQDSEGISINIKTVFGISIPIIIREGESTTKVTLNDVQLQSQGQTPKLSLLINRSGNMSVYGNLSVEHTAPDGTTTE
ncbi:MAG: molecular chaperone, partial [Salegentibacter sp.]